MATANNNLQISELDFNNIKASLTNFLKSQDTFKDYNFTGSGLNVLLDVLAYNTQYNAYYLNMVANEMFLDSATQRESVVSHAKELNYIPRSVITPTATVNVVVTGLSTSSLTLPKYSTFISENIDGKNYPFVSIDNQTVNVVANTATFSNLTIKQGIPVTYGFTYNQTSNLKAMFDLKDMNVDTTTLEVQVYPNPSNSAYDVYNLSSDYLTLNGESKVYFLQEGINGKYQIYFGDGVLGKQLADGSKVSVSYIVTKGTLAAGANSFTLTTSLGGTAVVNSLTSATSGSDRESIESIKFQAPKAYSAQNRAVSKNDYITAIQQNNLGFSFDSVNVWGGEQNDPPVYGQVFISMKPAGAYAFTETQKERIISEVIKPVSILTVTPTIVDPDYTYIKLNVTAYYDPTKTNLTAAQLENGIRNSVQNFAANTLNTFNSTFNSYELLTTIQNYDQSVITSEFKINLQKKFFPNLTAPTTYNLYYNTPLEKGILLSGVSSSPGLQFRDPLNPTLTIDQIYIEEVPSSTHGVESLSILNPGFGYQYAPTITIVGDGTGATAHAVIVAGSIYSIVIDTPGDGYTSAIATVTPHPGDTTGKLASLTVNLAGRYGTLRTYYNNTTNVKTIYNSNIGTVDYQTGLVTLNGFNPINVDNDLGQLAVTVTPTSSIISSSYNRIITVDPYDSTAIKVNVIAKTNK
jgi:hypothetical protein